MAKLPIQKQWKDAVNAIGVAEATSDPKKIATARARLKKIQSQLPKISANKKPRRKG